MSDTGVIESGRRSAHTRAREVRGEVLAGPERRRRWSTDEKLRILAQSVAPGSSPSLTRRLHGISSGQLYTWRKQFRAGELTGFIPSASRLGSEAGGARAAILYGVLETAKLNGLDPEAYLADVIDRMAKGHPINQLDDLLPWRWQRAPARMAA